MATYLHVFELATVFSHVVSQSYSWLLVVFPARNQPTYPHSCLSFAHRIAF